MELTQFWVVNKKLALTEMQMGYFNASMVFGAMVSALKQECQSEVEHQNIRDFVSEVIMDDIVLFKNCTGHYPTVF